MQEDNKHVNAQPPVPRFAFQKGLEATISRKKCWCIPPEHSAAFVAAMEDVLEVYSRPYAQVIRNGKGEVIALYPLMPNKMSVDRDENGRLYYTYYRGPDEAIKNKEFAVTLKPSDVLHMYRLNQVTDTEVFIDGTKIEASANKYTFVWKKAVTKHQARYLQKTALLVGDIIERYGFKPLWHKEVHKKHVKKYLKKLKAMASEENLQFVSGRGHRKEQLQKDIEDLRAALVKMKEYETQLHTCGNRNSYSKTDHDATFMHMKDDHIRSYPELPGLWKKSRKDGKRKIHIFL